MASGAGAGTCGSLGAEVLVRALVAAIVPWKWWTPGATAAAEGSTRYFKQK